MTKGLRLIMFIALGFILTAIYWYFKGTIFPKDTIGIVIYSSLLMLSFNSLILEHYFTKPTDVLSASIAVLLIITPLKRELSNLGVWYEIMFIFTLIQAILSIISLALFDSEKPDEVIRNKISKILKDFVVRFGNSKVQFFILFILTIFFYIDSKSVYFLVLFIYASFVLVDPWKFFLKIPSFIKKDIPKGIGQIFGVQSKNTFLVKLYTKRPTIKIFDFVEFRYSIDENKSIRKGLILDNYLLNQEQWIKVLVADEINQLFEGKEFNTFTEENIVFKITDFQQNDYLKRFVGIVDENSNISKIRFIHNSINEISDGQLLEINHNGKKVLYQVVQGITKIEQLEQKNESSYVIGEAIQLGIWIKEKGQFEKFGWVPFINSPVYFASDIQSPPIKDTEYNIGNIPNTNYPVTINKELAISHHTAILGITGSGKSIFARNLIREFLKSKAVKVICVDFTLEYRGKFNDLKPQNIISQENAEKLFTLFDRISVELEKFGNQQDKATLKEAGETIKGIFIDSISSFLKSDKKLAIFELPDVSNTSGILEYTKAFFKHLFEIAKAEKCFGQQVCMVLEEAHTVIPEWNFLGISEKTSQSLVNSIGQIALQGRKYGVGFLVIAQRTANVSKTVLTQCNTIISFQEYDKTSSEFLSNYFGQSIVETLPNLKFRQAIASGKALKSNVPLIFEVPMIVEPDLNLDGQIKDNEIPKK